MYTALSICYKAHSRVHETQWPWPLPVSSARCPHFRPLAKESGSVGSLYAFWVSRCRCLPECRNPRKRLGGKDNFLGKGTDPKQA